MKKIFNFLLSILLVIFSYLGGYPKSDSVSVLTFDAFMDIVKTHHPVTKQAELQLSTGEAILKSSRGAFDPKSIYGFRSEIL